MACIAGHIHLRVNVVEMGQSSWTYSNLFTEQMCKGVASSVLRVL